MQNIKINNSLGICVIDIEGIIGVNEDWQFDSAGDRVATYEKFQATLSQIKALECDQIVVNIRSTGGDVNDALLIYEALTSLDIPITTRCYGYVASAATVIAQAASQGERQISANALYLVHNSTCVAEGNSIELQSKVELLEKTDIQLSELYAARSGRTAEEFKTLMNEQSGNGRWLTSEETIEAGLADKLVDSMSVASGEQEAETKEGAVTNLIRRIGRRLGLIACEHEAPINMHNILHDQIVHNSTNTIAISEGQKSAQPTALMGVEDPTLQEQSPTANQKAYSTDVQAFMR